MSSYSNERISYLRLCIETSSEAKVNFDRLKKRKIKSDSIRQLPHSLEIVPEMV